MAERGGVQRLWLIILLALVVVALPGHIFAEAALSAHGLGAGTAISQLTACLHTGAVMPAASAIPLDAVPHLELRVASPVLHDACAPVPFRPPIPVSSR